MSEERRSMPSRAIAKIHRTRWPGWIWAVPIVAFVAVAWLGFRSLTSGGTEITIVFDDAHGLKKGSSDVVYRGITVGEVNSVRLADNGNGVKVKAEIEESASGFLRSGTRFWLRGAHPSLGNLASLGAILSGPTIVMEPGAGEKTTHFQGLTRQPIRPAGEGDSQRYLVDFGGAVGDLKRGDPVKLRGFTVGQVEEVAVHFDAESGTIATPVTLLLFPSLFHIEDAPNPASVESLRAAVSSLIKNGLHAQLERDPPFLGSYAVTLEVVPEMPSEQSTAVNGVPEIPVMPDGGVQALVARLNSVPVERISQNMLDITRDLKKTVSSLELKDSIDQLHAALKQIRETAATAGPEITQTVATLRGTADQLEQTVRSADKTVRSADELIGAPTSQTGLRTAVEEATYAIRAIRELANYLDRHPEALVHGRSGEE